MSTRAGSLLERALLLAPDRLARAAAVRATRPEERWMLQQTRAVRETYVREVLAAAHADRERAQQVWILRQPRAVRESYAREVLGAGDAPAR